MRAIIPGHVYELDHLDHDDTRVDDDTHEYLRFVHKERNAEGAFVTVRNGTTNEEVIACLIDRITGLNAGPWSCKENACAITKLEEALMWLNARTAKRQARGVEGTDTP